MEQRPKTNDGKLNDWQMDQIVRGEKKAHQEDQKDTKEIPVITDVRKK